MSILRIKELEQQLQRRDERLAKIEAKVKSLGKYGCYCTDPLPDYEAEAYMAASDYGHYFLVQDVLECLK